MKVYLDWRQPDTTGGNGTVDDPYMSWNDFVNKHIPNPNESLEMHFKGDELGELNLSAYNPTVETPLVFRGYGPGLFQESYLIDDPIA